MMKQVAYLGKLYNLHLDDDVDNTKELLVKWYKQEAKKVLPPKVSHYAAQYNLVYRKLKITSARTRWGSCNSLGNLSLSWRLVMLPPEIIDYVIIHELAHLVHLDHSRNFWQKVQSIMPDYKDHKNWLKIHGTKHLHLCR